MRFYVLLSIVILAACAPVRVQTLKDPTVDFSQYKSWCWLEGCHLPFDGPNHLNDTATIEAVANAVALEMFNKGYTQKGDSADLLVDFHIVVKEDSAIFSMIHEEDLPFWNNNEKDYYHFLRGSLLIHIGDRRTGRMIWQSNSKRLMALKPNIKESDINEGVKKALKKFPVRKD